MLCSVSSFAQQKGGVGVCNGYNLKHCSFYMTPETNVTLTTANEYYTIKGTMNNGTSFGWSCIGDSAIVYSYKDSCIHTFWGNSDMKANKLCTITYALFRNSEAAPFDDGCVTPRTLEYANSYVGMTINRDIWIHTNDTLYIKAKSTAANTTLTIYQLQINLKSYY